MSLSPSTVAARRGQPLAEILVPRTRVARSAVGPRARAARGAVEPRAKATWKPVELSVTQRHDLIDVWTVIFTEPGSSSSLSATTQVDRASVVKYETAEASFRQCPDSAALEPGNTSRNLTTGLQSGGKA